MGYLLAELILVLLLGTIVPVLCRTHPHRTRTPAPESGDGPAEAGTLLGGGPDGPVFLTDEEVNAHVLVLGATGSGKTTTLLRFMESAVARGIALIVVDGKADPGLAARVKGYAAACGRTCRHFDMARPEGSAPYNPVKGGSALELRDRLMACSEWSEPHYKFAAARYLAEGIALVRAAGQGQDIPSLVRALEPHNLALLARSLPREERLAVNDLVDGCGKDAGGLLNRLAAYTPRETAALLRDDPGAIDLGEVWAEGGVALFSLDSLGYPEQARMVGRLFVLDLKAAAARMLAHGRPVFVVLDEFGVLAGAQVADLLNKSRASGMHLILAVQELADLRAGGGQTLMEQVLGNTNVKIIHRQDVPASAELLAKCIGERDDFRVQWQARAGGWSPGTVTPARSFWVAPDEIKRLTRGEAVVMVKHPAFSVKRTRITRGGGGDAAGVAV
ncbi:MAG: DUF853 family protein [Peptococcaceae bacterium]|jgi:hypothetical protein|nr:DUF853 family protein [Peptococcaceae bacterium]